MAGPRARDPHAQENAENWMASLAVGTATRAVEKRVPSPWLAAGRTVLTPGLGHFYIGLPKRGIAFFVLILLANSLLMFAMMGVLARFWMFAVNLALLVGLWAFTLVDATVRAYRMPEYRRQAYNRWEVYAGALALSWLITAIPCIYATYAKASGPLGYFRAIGETMAPTLRRGEYFLADTTYYRTRQPSRGEVAVYVHPKQPDVHYIKRIVATEGDRIAIRGGRAIVNGMAVEEPYVEPGNPKAAFADVPETRVPAGHVFVLGDNRGFSVDSRNVAVHGPVPIGNLIGRVTDIVFSSRLTRLGRWIGTPSNF
jgi:signal peptidase I